MLDKALSMGVEAIKRPSDLADESRPLSDFFDYICTLINEGHLMWACCTSPLFGVPLLKKAISLYFEKLAYVRVGENNPRIIKRVLELREYPHEQ